MIIGENNDYDRGFMQNFVKYIPYIMPVGGLVSERGSKKGDRKDEERVLRSEGKELQA